MGSAKALLLKSTPHYHLQIFTGVAALSEWLEEHLTREGEDRLTVILKAEEVLLALEQAAPLFWSAWTSPLSSEMAALAAWISEARRLEPWR